jgi:hypothetical protein
MPRNYVILQLIIAAVALPAAGLLWFMFVRQVPEKSATAVIRSKTFLDAHTITRYPSNIFRQTWTPQQIRINEAFVFGLAVEGQDREALFALDTVSSRVYEVGQTVQVTFEERGLPPIWTRLRVKGVRLDAEDMAR